VLGSLGLSAERAGAAELARRVDRAIGADLGRRRRATEDTFALIEAAGNAGCVSCSEEIRLAVGSPRPALRRSAFGAYRFVAGPAAVAAMCVGLRTDPVASVRAHAAWALGWSRSDLEARVRCLRSAVVDDSSADVRSDAAHALDALERGGADRPAGELAF
jgi:hypothetical protein